MERGTYNYPTYALTSILQLQWTGAVHESIKYLTMAEGVLKGHISTHQSVDAQ